MQTIPEAVDFGNTMKPLSLPQVGHHASMNSTKSELNTILSDRKTFVNKYFEELTKIRGKGTKRLKNLATSSSTGGKSRRLYSMTSLLC